MCHSIRDCYLILGIEGVSPELVHKATLQAQILEIKPEYRWIAQAFWIIIGKNYMFSKGWDICTSSSTFMITTMLVS